MCRIRPQAGLDGWVHGWVGVGLGLVFVFSWGRGGVPDVFGGLAFYALPES